MTTLRIRVTKEVLQATKDCGSSYMKNCAIAYAIRGIWPMAMVGNIWISIVEHSLDIRHDQEIFIGRFDNATPAERAAMQPFSFEIEVPDEVIGEVNIEEIRRICEGSKTLELVK